MTAEALLTWFREWAEASATKPGVSRAESDALRFIALPALEDAVAGRYRPLPETEEWEEAGYFDGPEGSGWRRPFRIGPREPAPSADLGEEGDRG